MKTMFQLWLPYFPMSPFNGANARDLQRAKKEWNNEQRIYLSPDYENVSRLKFRNEKGFLVMRGMTIPSETTNIIEVINVDNEGNHFPPSSPGIPEEWKGKVPENLVLRWLNSKPPKLFTMKEITLLFPEINSSLTENSKIELIEKKFVPGTFIVPTFGIDEELHSALFKWPPENSSLPITVSPGSEIKEYGKSGDRIENNVPLLLAWDEQQFNEMFILSTTLDHFYYLSIMKEILKKKNKKEIFSWRDKFVSKIKCTLELAWLYPKYAKDMFSDHYSNDTVFDIETKFGIHVDKIEDIFNHDEYDKKFRVQTEIPCIFSWIGYCWWELGELIKEKTIKTCERCGNIIVGKEDKRFCSKEENPACFNARRAEDRKRERNNW